jgi:hypothetical protein
VAQLPIPVEEDGLHWIGLKIDSKRYNGY